MFLDEREVNYYYSEFGKKIVNIEWAMNNNNKNNVVKKKERKKRIVPTVGDDGTSLRRNFEFFSGEFKNSSERSTFWNAKPKHNITNI